MNLYKKEEEFNAEGTSLKINGNKYKSNGRNIVYDKNDVIAPKKNLKFNGKRSKLSEEI